MKQVFYIVIIAFGLAKCADSSNPKEEKTSNKKESSSIDSTSVVNDDNDQSVDVEIDTLDILVLPIANGYEYSMHNYDFTPALEKTLDELETINVTPFPYKTLMGVTYLGVFDKKYCPPIIEKVNVDFLILSRFDKVYSEINSTEMKWGYELRIVNAKTLKQINLIQAHNLDDYQAIEKHIKSNILKLKSDLENLK